MASQSSRVLSLAVLGTLIDDRAGLAAGLEAGGVPPAAAPMLADRALVGVDSLLDELDTFVGWQQVLARAVEAAAEASGLQVGVGTAEQAVSGITEWPLFDDVLPALAALAPRFRLALLSNLDQRQLEQVARRLGGTAAHLVGADRVGCFLPEPDHLMALVHEMEVDEDRVLHVSARAMADLLPAEGLGMAHAWLHRPGEAGPGEVEIQLEVDDLLALARRLNRRGRRRH